MSRRGGGRRKTRGVSPDGAAVGADLGGSSKYSNENFEGRRGERFHVNGTCTWPEVGSSGRKSTARRVVSGAPPAALENPEDRVSSAPGRTHNRIRSPRIGSEGWARGSQSRTRRLPVHCSSCSRGDGGSPRAGRGTDWERLLRGPSPGDEQSTQNCETTAKGTGLAESAGKEDPVELDSSPTL
ncbi:hypothetical protein V6N13_080958 [Hibiscus sabdariffa]